MCLIKWGCACIVTLNWLITKKQTKLANVFILVSMTSDSVLFYSNQKQTLYLDKTKEGKDFIVFVFLF